MAIGNGYSTPIESSKLLGNVQILSLNTFFGITKKNKIKGFHLIRIDV